VAAGAGAGAGPAMVPVGIALHFTLEWSGVSVLGQLRQVPSFLII